MDHAVPGPLSTATVRGPVRLRGVLAAAALLTVGAAAILGSAAGQAGTRVPASIGVHRVVAGPAGIEFYDASAGAALGERIVDGYLELGGNLPTAYERAGPFFFIVSSSNGAHGRLTLGTDFA